MNNVISLQDINWALNTKQEEQEVSIDYTDFYSDDYEKILSHDKAVLISKNGIKEDLTVLDLLNIPYLDDAQLIRFVENRLKIDLDSKKWIERVNLILQKSIDLIEKRYQKRINAKIKWLKIRNKEDLINFLKETKTNKTSWFINCAIAKVWYAVNDILTNEHIRQIWFLDREFIRLYMDKYFQPDRKEEYEEYWVHYRKYNFVYEYNWEKKIISFRCITRQKWEESIVWKEIADPKYFAVDEFKDLVWSTIYVDNYTDAAILMQYIDQVVYSWEAKISNKNWLDLEEVKKNIYLDEEFYLRLEEQTKVSQKQKSKDELVYEQTNKWTSTTYREIKLVWDCLLPMSDSIDSSMKWIWTEIKFVLNWQDNEQWLSLHNIYDIFKKFRELTRLGIPIRKIDIVNYVNDFFNDIEKLLKKKNKDKDKYYQELYNDLKSKWFITSENISEKELAIWLYKYFSSQLIPIRLWKSKKEYFFDKRWLNMRDLWLQKEEIQKI